MLGNQDFLIRLYTYIYAMIEHLSGVNPRLTLLTTG